MDYGKITSDGRIQRQPNPVFVTISNPNDGLKRIMADLRGELEMVYTDQPQYDPETQYVTDYWQEEDGNAVQHWEIHDKPEPEPTLEDRVESLEGNVSDIINGVTGDD